MSASRVSRKAGPFGLYPNSFAALSAMLLELQPNERNPYSGVSGNRSANCLSDSASALEDATTFFLQSILAAAWAITFCDSSCEAARKYP
jgi:hypothetical protein